MRQDKQTVDPNKIKARDYALLALIQGATKSGTHVDRKKRANKRESRDWKHRDHNE